MLAAMEKEAKHKCLEELYKELNGGDDKEVEEAQANGQPVDTSFLPSLNDASSDPP